MKCLTQGGDVPAKDGGGGGDAARGYEMGKRSESEHVIHRLLLMSYFPSGFW